MFSKRYDIATPANRRSPRPVLLTFIAQQRLSRRSRAKLLPLPLPKPTGSSYAGSLYVCVYGLVLLLCTLACVACGDSSTVVSVNKGNVSPSAISTATAATATNLTKPAGTTAQEKESEVLSSELTKEQIASKLREEGATLNLYWPAGGNIKTWLDNKLVPGYKQYIKDTYGVDMTVNVLPAGGGDNVFILKLQTYEQQQQEQGRLRNPNSPPKRDFEIDVARIVPSADLMSSGQKGWLTSILPDYAKMLPNLGNVNKPGLNSFTTTQGKTFAISVYQPTISFFYNKEKVPNPPKSIKELGEWAKANPQRFTYEDPRSSSGIGSGAMFLLSVMKAFGDPDKPETYAKGLEFLKTLQTSLYPQPTESSQMLDLMKRGDIWVMAFWNDFGLSAARDQNISFMHNYFPEEGSPVRNTPLVVPRSAAHQLAGLLFVNYALAGSVQKELALITQQIPASTDPNVWKDLPLNTFGYDFSYIQARTFAAFNSAENLAAIKTLVEQYTKVVLLR
jgi:spermidine/putrescine-binding protein